MYAFVDNETFQNGDNSLRKEFASPEANFSQ